MTSSKVVYGIILIFTGVVTNLLISGTNGLQKQEKLSVYMWSTIIMVSLIRAFYK